MQQRFGGKKWTPFSDENWRDRLALKWEQELTANQQGEEPRESDYRKTRLQLRVIDTLKPCPLGNRGPGI